MNGAWPRPGRHESLKGHSLTDGGSPDAKGTAIEKQATLRAGALSDMYGYDPWPRTSLLM